MRAILILFVGLLFVVPEPAHAATKTVYVESHVGFQNANLRKGVQFVDKYTMTRFILGKCRTGQRCIVVKVDKGRKRGTAWASWKTWDKERMRVTVTVNPAGGSAYMQRLFAHEIGHAMFLSHSRYATNVMWAPLHVNGKLVPWRFTAPQKAVLRKH
jgi:hypothetical protein